MSTVDLRFGDCLAVLRELPDESVHAIVTDPPYGLEFMGADWDGQVPGVAYWRECLRVAKPGAHLLAFGGTRTFHRLAVAIEDAGWEIRDSISWLYGSGMPKGLNIGKAIDKAGGDPLAFRRFARAYATAIEASDLTHSDVDRQLGLAVGGSSCYWAREDHRGGLPPRHHWEQVRDLLGLETGLEQLYDEAEREVIGHHRRTGKEAGTYGAYVGDSDITTPATPEAARWEGWNTSLKPAQEPIIVARKPLAEKNVAANVLAHGTGGINVDACRVRLSQGEKTPTGSGDMRGRATYAQDEWTRTQMVNGGNATPAAGRWPANVVLVHDVSCEDGGVCAEDVCPVAELDRQAPNVGNNGQREFRPGAKFPGAYGDFEDRGRPGLPKDKGGGSRFFPTFYQAKAPASERPKIDGKGWNTVKPQGLMRWLVRLVTPPGGTVLDPFCGTAATLQAARDEGFASIGIERDEFAYRLACQRLGLPEVVPVPVVDAEAAEEVVAVDPVLVAISEATSGDELTAVWREHEAGWTDEYTAAVRARLAGIASVAA
jgi:hypothetical protein